MDTIRHLLGFFLKISVAIFFLVLILWLVSSIPRSPLHATSTTSNGTTTAKTDLLPSPRTYSGFFSATGTDITKPKVFVAPEPYVYNGQPPFTTKGSVSASENGDTGYSYTTYTYDGSGVLVPANISNGQTIASPIQSPSVTPSNQITERSLYIRNLSIYEKGNLYTGLSFIGEARSAFFRDGKFPIIVADANGRVIGVSYAVATTKWTVPGWVRFESKITYPLPNNTPCMMIFEEAFTVAEQKLRAPHRILLGMKCN